MLKEYQWYPLLILHLHASDVFTAQQLDQVMDVAAWYYENDYSPLEAAKCLLGGKMVIDAVRRGINSEKAAAEDP